MLLIVIISFFASCDSPIDDNVDLNAESKMTLHMKKSKTMTVPGPPNCGVTELSINVNAAGIVHTKLAL
jgi:hypothetical protein